MDTQRSESKIVLNERGGRQIGGTAMGAWARDCPGLISVRAPAAVGWNSYAAETSD